MSDPRISLESREHYHGRVKGSINDFHMGHFRIVEYDFPLQPNQVIYAEFSSTGPESDGMAPIFGPSGSLVARVPQSQLSQVSYSLALAMAMKHLKETGFRVEDRVSGANFLLEKAVLAKTVPA